MFDIGFLYAIVAFVCMLLAGIVLNRTLATKYRETIDRSFCTLLIFFIVFCLVDAVWGFFTSRALLISRPGYTVSTYGFHFMAALSAYVWAGYMCHYLGLHDRVRSRLNVLRALLLLTQVALLTSNIWTGDAFVINESVEYVTGKLRPVMFAVQFAYYIILTVCVLHMIFRRSNPEKLSVYRTAVIFSLIPLLFGIFQLIFPDAPMYSIGFAISAVTIYAFNITSQRETYLTRLMTAENHKLLSIIAGLSDDFQMIYYVDMESNRYETFGNGDNPVRSMLSRLTPRSGDFFADRLLDTDSIVHPEDYAAVCELLSKEHVLEELKSKRSYSFNYRLMVGGAPRYYTMKVIRSDISGEENKIIVGVFDADEQIREEMRQQEQLRTAREQAEKANKAKSLFLFNMSHDIRTPMNAILGFTDMAQKHMDDPERVRDCLNKVELSGKHLLSLINDVLDMSRIESGKIELSPAPIAIRSGADMIVPIFEELSREKDVNFTWECRDLRHETVLCDYLRVNQILINLLSNAVKYTKAGGSVHYCIEESDCEIAGSARYRFTVRDSGIGMTTDFLEHIFEDFARAESSTRSGVEGTGLGMAIVKRLVDMMGGSIDIESSPGQGTTVVCTLCFPIADAAEASAGKGAAQSDAGEWTPAGKRILLVEDNALNREIAREILEDEGILVEEAEDGSVAVEAVRAAAPGYYDLILMDIQMPQMDGYTAARAIRALQGTENAAVPILAMTANTFDEDKRNALAAGMNGHLSKPISMDELTSALQRFL